MIDPARPAASAPRRQGGFTLLEIMVSLSILAVGAVCVLSTFAAALALQLRRENDERAARVVEEARGAAQSAYDSWTPARPAPGARGPGGGAVAAGAALRVPEPIPDTTYSRDPKVVWSVRFLPAEGIPVDAGVAAEVTMVEERDSAAGAKKRVERIFLAAGGLPAGELQTSRTHEEERVDAEERRRNPPRPRERPR